LFDLSFAAGLKQEADEAIGLVEEALTMADFGPLPDLMNETRRLWLRADSASVVGEADALLRRLDEAASAPARLDVAGPEVVREYILSVASIAAKNAGQWRRALEFNSGLLVLLEQRSADQRKIARTRLGDFTPLINLGWFEKASQVLDFCEGVATESGDVHQHREVRAL